MIEESCFVIFHLVIFFFIDIKAVLGRECYNYKEDPEVRDCPHGCCGDDYAEYCCDATLQIVGCAIGAVLVLAAIIAAVYYCYRKKRSKRRLAQGSGPSRTTFVTRFGFRTRPANPRDAAGSRQRPRGQQNMGVAMNPYQLNPTYIPSIPTNGGREYNYPSNQSNGPPLIPTAPMPPPYSMMMAPPPYTNTKQTQPPPEYNTVVHGHKSGIYSDTLTPPSF